MHKSVITLDMGEVKNINKVVLAENIETGQQIEKFKLYYFFDKKWHKLYSEHDNRQKENLSPADNGCETPEACYRKDKRFCYNNKV